MSSHDNIKTVHTIAETIAKINDVKIPSIEIPEIDAEEIPSLELLDEEQDVVEKRLNEYIENKKVEVKNESLEDIDIDGINQWWKGWCEVRKIIDEEFEYDVEGGNCATLTEDEPNDSMEIRNEFINFGITVYTSGEVYYAAEYVIDIESNTWGMLYEGSGYGGINKIELGRKVARAELAIIANTTASAAETIDYWQTELDADTWSQKRWADVRGVNRQSVNDRVRGAIDSLE